jgi:hypothetical protein
MDSVLADVADHTTKKLFYTRDVHCVNHSREKTNRDNIKARAARNPAVRMKRGREIHVCAQLACAMASVQAI